MARLILALILAVATAIAVVEAGIIGEAQAQMAPRPVRPAASPHTTAARPATEPALPLPSRNRAEAIRPPPPRVMPLPPTAPAWEFGPGFPQPPTPSGRLPSTTSRWPFEMLPYYYTPPRSDDSPYTRYLLSSPSALDTFHISPLKVPNYVPPYYQVSPSYSPWYAPEPMLR